MSVCLPALIFSEFTHYFFIYLFKHSVPLSCQAPLKSASCPSPPLGNPPPPQYIGFPRTPPPSLPKTRIFP